MDGLIWWEHDGMKILRVDYNLVQDPLQLLHNAALELYSTERDLCFSLVNFGRKTFPDSFLRKHAELAADLVQHKKLIIAYVGLLPKYHEIAKRTVDRFDDTATVMFFETEPFAIEWLLSFKSVVD